jgi:predicted metalloendopeptidase
MTLVERRDPEKTYNLRSAARFEREAPGLDWKAYFAAAGARDLAELNVAQPAAAAAVAKLAAELAAADWRAYLRWHVLNATATKLPREFEEAHFPARHAHRRSPDVAAQRARHRTIGGRVGSEPLGRWASSLWARRFPRVKRRALELVGHVKAACASDWSSTGWRTGRKAALDKLDRMAVKIGYPDRWRDYSTAAVGEQSFVQNWLAANAFEFGRNLARLGGPVDRGEWWMSPHVVTASFGAG